ncbi:hypothetical protein FRB95_005578 [Tulasnella sp. JGI-2019a]|nr:hypothetical protein FRB93_007181 [Tulasnella sp. JGI-2019a]KAG9029208.1 hypothetical protein FRB95_005578 [Tulasnella sp. JGI-2019a]
MRFPIGHILPIALALGSHIITATQIPISMSNEAEAPLARPLNTLPPLFDTLILQRSSSIFFDYLREVPSVSTRIADLSKNSTLLVPSNKAVIALGWKPERGPPVNTPSGKGEVEISEVASKENVVKWVEAHVLPTSDLDLGSKELQPTLRDGKSVTIGRRGDLSTGSEEWKDYGVVQGDQFVPFQSRIEASNGVVYLLDGTVDID